MEGPVVSVSEVEGLESRSSPLAVTALPLPDFASASPLRDARRGKSGLGDLCPVFEGGYGAIVAYLDGQSEMGRGASGCSPCTGITSDTVSYWRPKNDPEAQDVTFPGDNNRAIHPRQARKHCDWDVGDTFVTKLLKQDALQGNFEEL